VNRRLHLPERYELAGTLRPLVLPGHDPTARIGSTEAWWATRTPDGPGTLHLRRDGTSLVARAYGPGAGWLLERAAAVAGLHDDLAGFAALAEGHPLVRRLARTLAGLRLTATGRLFHHLLPMVLSQKVTGLEAHRSYTRILRRFGSPAPGPRDDLRLPPEPELIAATPYYAFHPMGVERKRAETLRRVAARAAWLEAGTGVAEATARLMSLPGIGPWTTAEVVRVAFGDPDAVTVGDYHLPNIVAYALAGEARATDARMLELLAPFAGHRARVCTLLTAAGLSAPRFGPRAPVRSFAHF
jgi:3-methyladenine DNA glycosylase/8-oxoguanine DNA glycosylase